MIDFADTTVARREDLFRFQIEEYESPQYDLIRVYKNNGRKGIERKRKTIYDEDGYPWYASTETGEILRRKKANEVKFCVDTSLARTRRVMREILMANKWDWFVTLTFNNLEQNRLDDKKVMEQFKKFRKDIRKRYPNMYYLAVTEYHKKGGIHFHLVVGGISEAELKLVYSGYKQNGKEVYNSYAWKYGFSTVTKVESTEKVSGYILKYIGKDLGISEACKKRYWASRNCARPKKKFVDIVTDEVLNVFDFFHKIVDCTVTMTVQYWNKVKNYLTMKDNAPNLRKMRFYFDRFNLSAHDDFWKQARRI